MLSMVLGSVLRYWSMRILGASFTRTLKITGQQILVQDGTYRLIRHPGYLGTLLMWSGAGLAMLTWLVVFVVALLMVNAYLYRIHQEEAMPLESFGDAFKATASVPDACYHSYFE